MRKRVICVGDIHGLLDEFRELVELCEYDKTKDRLCLSGDLTDRGPNSSGVISYAAEIGAELCIGNHDYKYIRFNQHEQKKTHVGRKHYKNPMQMSSEKMKVWASLSKENLEYLEAGKYCIPLWEYNALLVHGGIIPSDKPLDKREREEYLYTRYIDKDTLQQATLGVNFTKPPNSIHWTEAYDGHVDIVYGHDVRSMTSPVVEYNSRGARMIGIDTGSCFGGHLSAIIFSPENPEGVFKSVKAKKCWVKYTFIQTNEQIQK